MTLMDLLVVQKTASVVQKTPSVVQNQGVPLIKEEEEEEQYSPQPPSQAREGFLPSLVASADGNSQSKKPSHDGNAAKDVRAAISKAMRECNLSDPRMTTVIDRAMRLEAEKTDAAPDWNAIAERMAKNYGEYLANLHLMASKPGPRKFFAHGMWADQRKWPWDEKERRTRRQF
jgi:hypothetical protein